MAVLRFHCNKSAVHELHHIAYGVHGAHLQLYASLLIVEHLDFVWLVHPIIHRVGVVGIFLLELFVVGLTLGNAFDESGYLLMLLVLPWICVAPVVLEVALHLLHLLDGGSLGILLHAGVNGSIDFQSAGIQVVSIVLAPILEVVGHCLAEICCLTVVVALHVIVESDRFEFEGVVGGVGEISMVHHIIKYGVAALKTILGINAWVIVCGSLEHTHKDCCLIGGEILWCGAEIGLTSCLDTKGIATEINGVGIHGEDVALVEDKLQFHCCNPLLALHYKNLKARNATKKTGGVVGANTEEVLCQLLGDGRGTTGIMVDGGVLDGCKHADKVDAPVIIESLVFCIYESFPEFGIDLLIFHRSAVFIEILAYHHAVGTVYL